MRVYAAGPMTGKALYNWPAFKEAAAKLMNFGYSVVTPFELNSIVWERHFGREFNPGVDKCEYGDQLLCEMAALDLQTVCEVDAVAVLEGWQQSKGARLEVLLAEQLGKIILDATTGERISTTIMQHMHTYGAYQNQAQWMRRRG